MKVRNMTSSSGNEVANQFIIETDKGELFQSYNSAIAFIPNDSSEKIRLGKNWDYSPPPQSTEINFWVKLLRKLKRN